MFLTACVVNSNRNMAAHQHNRLSASKPITKHFNYHRVRVEIKILSGRWVVTLKLLFHAHHVSSYSVQRLLRNSGKKMWTFVRFGALNILFQIYRRME